MLPAGHREGLPEAVHAEVDGEGREAGERDAEHCAKA